jgi:hypothetical protein
MGWGDELMAAGEVKRLAAGSQRVYRITDSRGNKYPLHRWNELWTGNPHIAAPGQPFDDSYENRPGLRPYIADKVWRQFTWRAYHPEPADMFLTDLEIAIGRTAAGSVVVNPDIKDKASPNKKWSRDNWEALIRLNATIDWVQVSDGTTPPLRGARVVHTRSFREACAVMAQSRAAVLHEGGLHHAAAAHHNLFTGGAAHPLGCGLRLPCAHCADAMRRIRPNDVMQHLEAILCKR